MASDAVQIQLVLRLALGLIFLFSALTKLRAPAAFVRGVLDYHVLPAPLARAYGWLLPFVELGTALLLLSGFFVAVAAGLAALMLVSFAVAIVLATTRGRQVGCSCFAAAESGRVGWHTLGRDLALLLPALWLLGIAVTAPATRQTLARNNLGVLAEALLLALLLALTYVLVAEGLDLLVGLMQRSAEWRTALEARPTAKEAPGAWVERGDP